MSPLKVPDRQFPALVCFIPCFLQYRLELVESRMRVIPDPTFHEKCFKRYDIGVTSCNRD